jgi:hypothetical protein
LQALRQPTPADLTKAEHLGDCTHDELGSADHGQVNEEDAIGESNSQLAGDLHCQASFADSRRATQREQAGSGKNFDLPSGNFFIQL